MLYVVVHLLEPRKRIIIPESFIFSLCEQSLKNVGKNSNHSYLIYYSKSVLGDGTSAPDVNCVPDFRLPLSKVFPPDDNSEEACYMAQLKYFFSEYEYYYIINVVSNFVPFPSRLIR